MKVKTLLLFCALLCFGAPQMVEAQDQGQPAVQISTEPAAPGVINDLGIKDYVLGTGDTIDVRIFQQPDLSSTAEVDNEGFISTLPFIKPIPAKCRTDKDVAKDISAAYAKFLQNPQVSVRVTGRNSRPPAIVHGAVNQPQRVQMMRSVRLNEIIAVSGGITEKANGSIQVLHTAEVMCPAPGEVVETETPALSNGLKGSYKVYKISDLLAGKEEANPIIRPGDVVTVTEAEPVYITGSVVNPQGVYLRDQLTLGRALAMVGGVRQDAKANDVRIHRQKPGASEQIISVNYAAIKKGQQKDVLLEAYDVIEVPDDSPFSKGNILRTLGRAVLNIGPSVVGGFGTRLPQRILY
ncbi:MAG: polysaccharide biosynthesis/export family protein [Pyrinomonadaceae bacterium]